jgi:hypothetical protein
MQFRRAKGPLGATVEDMDLARPGSDLDFKLIPRLLNFDVGWFQGSEPSIRVFRAHVP